MFMLRKLKSFGLLDLRRKLALGLDFISCFCDGRHGRVIVIDRLWNYFLVAVT